jgi:hypothetical protein
LYSFEKKREIIIDRKSCSKIVGTKTIKSKINPTALSGFKNLYLDKLASVGFEI